MSKTPEEITPNFGPVYAAALYPGLAKICQRHGYALAVHGSLARDLDLVAVPWATVVSTPEAVLEAITATYSVSRCGDGDSRPHGRTAYMISVGFGECALDISFMPSLQEQPSP
jgi:hypothetical protein